MWSCLGLTSLLIAQSTQSPIDKPVESLRFSEDGIFHISILEDLHFGENAWDSWGPEQDVNTVTVINRVLDKESPNLVVLNGDLITGENAFLENSTVYLDQMAGPLVDRGLAWASTYGNHNSSFNLSRSDLLAREKRFANSRTEAMVSDHQAGVTNYYLPVYGSGAHHRERNDMPELLLWFFDSRGGVYYQKRDASGNEIPQPNWVDVSVVEWFQATNADLVQKHGKHIPSLVFVHIPINAALAVQTQHEVDSHKEPGINDDYPLAQQGQNWCASGEYGGSCSYAGQDELLMKALAQTHGVIGVFSGHDHGDTWCYKWDKAISGIRPVNEKGINLCFGSAYGLRGVRDLDSGFSTGAGDAIEAEGW
ncbi:hypothetical protein N7539_008265 [Penicillium diatomitis]|uniref:Calcineurin-like phosphoesterase domain-containing protein n=1 Tax=Penicillium diatomitis TaxID=2819901 RepID=A0A9X0BN45_9EURO|nr:uncharacterized protein N7539_008265 [Penicillium diatomitis]KAJ5475199.1 hypothetical protein N7539_008265 [Penicillium diatomitis]